MDLYGQKEKSIPQKIVIITIEILLLWVSYRILFVSSNQILTWLGIAQVTAAMERKVMIFTFSCIVFLRMAFMMFYL